MCISASRPLRASSSLETVANLSLVKTANQFSQFGLAMRIGASLTSLAIALFELRTKPRLVKSIMRTIIDRNISRRNVRLRHLLVILKKSRKSLFDLKIVLTGIFDRWALQNRRSRFTLRIRNNWVNNLHFVSNISKIDNRRGFNTYFFVINFTLIIVSKLLLSVNKISPLCSDLIPGSAAIRALLAGRRPTLTAFFVLCLFNKVLIVLGRTIKRWLIV